MNVLLVGQGYVGLPVSMAAVSAGFHVTGFDTDPAKTDLLTGGGSHVEDIPSATVRAALDSGRYRVVSDAAESVAPEELLAEARAAPRRQPADHRRGEHQRAHRRETEHDDRVAD